jgi:hypothetical protein
LAGRDRLENRISTPIPPLLKTFPNNFYPVRSLWVTWKIVLLMIIWVIKNKRIHLPAPRVHN